MPTCFISEVVTKPVLLSLILLLVCLLIIITRRHRYKQFAVQKKLDQINSEHQDALLQTQIAVQEQTFRKISRDIHDNISLTLTLSKLHLNSLNYSFTGEVHDKMNLSIFLIGKAIEDLHSISKSLDSDIIATEGLIETVKNLIASIKKAGSYTVHFETRGSPVCIGANIELILFRIIQESLNNIIKHSEASIITLRFVFSGTGLEVTIQDNGIGFTVPQTASMPAGAGLKNIRIRSQMLNASLCISSDPGKGTLIRIAVPYTTHKITQCKQP